MSGALVGRVSPLHGGDVYRDRAVGACIAAEHRIMLVIAVVDVAGRDLPRSGEDAVLLHGARLRTRGQNRAVVGARYRYGQLLFGMRARVIRNADGEDLVVADRKSVV